MLHVLKCYDTLTIKKEWIHIRWSKEYLNNQFNPNTSDDKIKIYQMLYDNQPKGPNYNSNIAQVYPIYDAYNSNNVDDSWFPKQDFCFKSRITKNLWIESNKTNDPKLNLILLNNNHNMIDEDVILSQEQNMLNDMSFDVSDIDVENYEITQYTEKVGLLKRAQQLCGDNDEKHQELYNLLSNFVTSNEINNNDNDITLNQRKDGETTMISSNKVVTQRKTSTKRIKGRYEK